ncbi:Hsp90 cochaperone [Tritrichomonas musculus]|uniref:Hsp90 cochaperone n=1 Tax=Tritrichomonas musculus TaxID=1915356 RepID=A0ABR2JFH9_9EUKA
MASVEQLKNQGNQAFSSKEYSKAISFYSDAIELDSNNHTLFSNRSGAYCALGKYEQAASDARRAIELKPDWIRGYTRLGAALQGQQDWTAAEQTFLKALELDPDNQNVKTDLSQVRKNKTIEESQDEIASTSISHLFTDENLKRTFSKNSTFSELLKEPATKSMLDEIRSHPESIGKYYDDPNLMKIITAVLTGKTADDSEDGPSAEDWKNKGNEAFKAGKLDEALKYYNKAIELDEFNVTYYNNKATVFNKQGKFEDAIKLCQDAIQKGKCNYASPEAIARSYQKIASAQSSLGHLDLAIEALKASLAEKDDQQVQKELKKLENDLKKKKEAEFKSPELAEKDKIEGNRFFSKGEYSKAIECYSEAIKRQPKNAIYYANRAAAYTKLDEVMLAIVDCQTAIELDPKYVKAYTRKASCHFKMKDFDNARSLYNQALKLDPKNSDAIEGLRLIDGYLNSRKGK